MKTLYKKVFRVWAMGAVAMLIAAAAAGVGTSATYAAKDQQVPFSGSISGTLTTTGPITLALSGSGNSTHLGRTSYQGNLTFTSSSPGGLTNTLTETLTAANGDTITFLCTEGAIQVSPGVFQGNDQWVVVGGTGRFSNATGQGTATTQANLNLGTFSKQITGAISAPNGK